MAEKELLAYLVAHNLIRCVMAEAMSRARNRKMRRQLWEDLLWNLTRDLVRLRPDRTEPRAAKRRQRCQCFKQFAGGGKVWRKQRQGWARLRGSWRVRRAGTRLDALRDVNAPEAGQRTTATRQALPLIPVSTHPVKVVSGLPIPDGVFLLLKALCPKPGRSQNTTFAPLKTPNTPPAWNSALTQGAEEA